MLDVGGLGGWLGGGVLMLMLTRADAEEVTAPPGGQKETKRRERNGAVYENKHTHTHV